MAKRGQYAELYGIKAAAYAVRADFSLFELHHLTSMGLSPA